MAAKRPKRPRKLVRRPDLSLVRSFETVEAISSSPQHTRLKNGVPQMDRLLSRLRKKKRIVILAGAGISESAGIPTFVGPSSKKRDVLRREMLDSSVYNSDCATASFHAMIRSAKMKAEAANPTPFHHFAADLARNGRLLRLYTQNIDGLETRLEPPDTCTPLPSEGPWPMAVQLHGSMSTATCATCNAVLPLDTKQFDGPKAPPCPECVARDSKRRDIGKRSLGVGRLRPRIALYNEDVADAEAIGAVMEHDLRKKPDALIVVGTSLGIPGARDLVKAMSKAVRGRPGGLAVWINIMPEPSVSRGWWDFVVRETADTFASVVSDKTRF